MQFIAMTLLVAALGAMEAVGAVGASVERIVRDDFDTPTAEGDYKWALQTEGGIYHEQRSSKSAAVGSAGAEGAGGPVVQGQYQYTAPDGQVINVMYVADGAGFRAVGAHLPTPPPPPPAIARALAYVAKLRGQTEIN